MTGISDGPMTRGRVPSFYTIRSTTDLSGAAAVGTSQSDQIKELRAEKEKLLAGWSSFTSTH
jgi:hypothetical protein